MTVDNRNMMEQFVGSAAKYIYDIDKDLNVYVQETPTKVQYPCAIINKVDVNSRMLNSYMFINRITLFIRIFGKNEITVKNKAQNIIQEILGNHGKIPILNVDGTESNRFIRVEDINNIEIQVDQNEVFCNEINFSFETTHKVNVGDLGKIKYVHARFQ